MRRASEVSETSTASGADSATTLRRAYASNSRALRSSTSSIRWSTPSVASSRCTRTARTWPIRWARATACCSMVGLTCGSQRITTDAACRLIPMPPASICASSTACPAAAPNPSTSRWRRAGGTLPEIGPKSRPPSLPSPPSRPPSPDGRRPSASSTAPSTSRKEENTTTFSPLAAASATSSRSRCSFADLSGFAYAALRIAMKLPARTAAR